ncbi:TraB/GumN family protein [Sphingomonas sp. CGMCC 1.13654]|uniref:TraB/GumN family protein n=1 Tax=Sphingomonas chungangi TaxID=2683589 RepID=A0A838LCI8_9SPHN|nr:TraB/GumN family protein [Sphingomonas chungangi]MBA2935856.1 TraB/GumN family protein [Sphingomonas chungangi]MVW54547.1 TraB/GumN family protein [Sphingomonas chungangi]
MKLTRWRTIAAAFLALLQPALPSALLARQHVAKPQAHPAVWRVQKGNSTVYLFGTIHALPPNFEWETPEVRKVVGSADKLVLEAVIDQDPTKSAAALFKIGMAPGEIAPLAERIDPKYRTALTDLEKKSAVPAATLDKMKTWAAGMVLFGATVQTLGVNSADGVEERLKAEFRAANKPIEGLETLEQQLGFFDTMAEPQQREFLEGVVDQQADDVADFGKMLGAWAHGDEKGIARSFDKDMKKSDALRTVLIARRNAHWADAIVARLNQPGTQLVAVGAGHLVGQDSVQAMLAKLGYQAVRIE